MDKNEKIERLLKLRLYSEDLSIDLSKPSGRFQWFLASVLFGARISVNTAAKTYLQFEAAGLDSPEKIIDAGWDKLVQLLDAGGYTRYDFSTATKLLNIMAALKERYGSLENLRKQSTDASDIEKRLREFKGVGPTTVEIFLREMRGVWQINPKISSRAEPCAVALGLDLSQYQGEKLARIETGLVKIHIQYCKKARSGSELADCCARALELSDRE